MKTRTSSVMHWVLVALVICIAAFFRLYNLGLQSFWVDEVNPYFAAQSVLKGEGLYMPSGFPYGRAPVYTYSVALFSKILGPGEVATRLPAAIMGIAVVLLVYLIGRAMFGRDVALVAALLLAFSHFAVGWSRTAKMYTLLQMLTMAAAYAFLRGFEPDPGRKRRFIVPALEKKWQVSFIWTGLFLLISAYTFLRVHRLVGIFFASIIVYIGVRALWNLAAVKGKEKFLNKYSAAFLITVVVGVVAFMLIPWVRSMVQYNLTYTPAWARGNVSAAYRFVLFDFIMSVYRFPLGVFFFLGAILALAKGHGNGVFSLVLVAVNMALLSFVFTHRVPAYMLNIYPFFMLLAALAIVWFVTTVRGQSEILIKKAPESIHRKAAAFLVRFGVPLAVIFVFGISPWLRISLHVPATGDGKTNMAVTPGEWKQAGRFLAENRSDEDLVITNLPQVSSIYCAKPSYTLNFSLRDQAKRFPETLRNGRRVDVYAGVPCIRNLDDFKEITEARERVWLVFERYLFLTDAYTPAHIREYIRSSFIKKFESKNSSIVIYYRSNAGE